MDKKMSETPGQYEVDNAEGMERIQFSVPKKLLQQARELAEYEGWNQAEFHRMLWVLGFGQHAEASNKRLVNRGLRNKN
jgi:hypothetical protein